MDNGNITQPQGLVIPRDHDGFARIYSQMSGDHQPAGSAGQVLLDLFDPRTLTLSSAS